MLGKKKKTSRKGKFTHGLKPWGKEKAMEDTKTQSLGEKAGEPRKTEANPNTCLLSKRQ